MLIDIDTDDLITGPVYINEEERVEAQSSMKIGVFRANPLGDLICTIPAIRALRNCYPKAEITLFGLPWAQQFVKRFPKYFDHFKHFPGYPGLDEQLLDARATAKFINWAQSENFDLILQLQGNGIVLNPLVMLLNAKFCAGFFDQGHFNPNNGLFMEYPIDVHEVERQLMLVKHLGIESAGTELEFPLYEKDWQELRQLNIPLSYKEYVCINPGSGKKLCNWPPEYFARVADYCIMQNMKVVLTGTAGELPIVNQVKQYMQNDPIIIAGKTSIGAVGALIKNAFALVSNCTGISQIASALETPSVIISMDGEPGRWSPSNKKIHKTIDWLSNPDFNLVEQEIEMLFAKHFKKYGKVTG